MANPAVESVLRRGWRWLTVFAVLALSATLLAACGGGDNEKKTPTAAPTTAATTAPTIPAGSPVAGSPVAASPVAASPAAGTPVASPVASPAS